MRKIPFVVLMLLAGFTAHAAEVAPVPSGSFWCDRVRDYQALQRLAHGLKQREGVQMLLAILKGSQMGPGDGWFKPSQSQFGWSWLAGRFDKDESKSISREEFQGPKEFFERLDRNRDDKLDPEDFDWSDKSPFNRQAGMANQWVRFMDRNSNGRVTKEEWQGFFDRLAKEKGYLTPDDLRLAFNPPSGPRGKSDGPSPFVLIKGLLEGELGSFSEGPAVGHEAPEFVLKTQDGKQEHRLSQHRGKKPVVLVFGSFT